MSPFPVGRLIRSLSHRPIRIHRASVRFWHVRALSAAFSILVSCELRGCGDSSVQRGPSLFPSRVARPARVAADPVRITPVGEQANLPFDVRVEPSVPQGHPTRQGLLLARSFTLTAQRDGVQLDRLPEPVTLSVDMTGLVTYPAPKGQSHFLGYYDETRDLWQGVPFRIEADPTTRRVTFVTQTDHFSAWGSGTGLTPGWVPLFVEPQTSTFSGAAIYSHSLDVPPGRGGIQPSLTLAYNSRQVDGLLAWSQSGWVGHGWSLDLPMITRDFSMSGESVRCESSRMRLLLNGTSYLLVKGERVNTIGSSSGDAMRYYTQEYSNLYIERRNLDLGSGSPENNRGEYWIVRDPGGVEFRFGYTANAETWIQPAFDCLWGATYAEHESYAGPDTGNKPVAVSWALDLVTDPNPSPNRMVITYEKEPHCHVEWGNKVIDPYSRSNYPSSIRYNERTDAPGQFASEVKFRRATRTGIGTVRTDGDDQDPKRGCGKILFQSDSLQRIEVYQNSALMWAYALDYLLYDDSATALGDVQMSSRLLKTITQLGTDNQTRMPVTEFDYELKPNKGAECVVGVNCDCSAQAEQRQECSVNQNPDGQCKYYNPGPYYEKTGMWNTDCLVFNYGRLKTVRNGFGGKTVFTYTLPDRPEWWRWISYAVQKRELYDGHYPMAVRTDVYAYTSPCYSWFEWDRPEFGSDDLYYPNETICRPLDPSKPGGGITGYAQVTVTSYDRYKDCGGQPYRQIEHNYFAKGADPTFEEKKRLGRETFTRGLSGDGQTAYQTTDSRYDVPDILGYPLPRWRVRPSIRIDTAVEGSGSPRSKHTAWGYDDYDNVIWMQSGDYTNAFVMSRWENMHYINDTTNWRIGMLDWKTVNAVSGAILTNIENDYDAYGRLSKAKVNLGSTWAVTEFTYDNWGNVIQVVDPRGNSTSTEYNGVPGLNLLPSKVTNALGHFSTTTYDPVLLLPRTITSPNNAVTDTQYDVLGRVLRNQQYPSGNPAALESDITYAYRDAVLNGDVLTRAFRTQATARTDKLDASKTVTGYFHYNGMGRLIQEEMPASVSGKGIVKNYRYHPSGQVWWDYNPALFPDDDGGSVYDGGSFIPGAYIQALDDTFLVGAFRSFDALGRLTKVVRKEYNSAARPVLSEHAYLPWKTLTRDANGSQIIHEKDENGLLVRAYQSLAFSSILSWFPHGCTGSLKCTQYGYDGRGLLTSIRDEEGNVGTRTYDLGSRMTSMTDPDLGTWNYTYDANGNLITSTDARRQRVELQYDRIDRLTTKQWQEAGSQTWRSVKHTYDTGTNQRGLRTALYDNTCDAQVRSGTACTTWAYDIYGKLLGETKKTFNPSGSADETFYTNFVYDMLGRPTTVRYPYRTGESRESVTTTYNGQGLVSSLKGSTNTYLSSSLFNASGQPTSLTLGNGLTRSSTYNLNTGRPERLQAGILQDSAYTYDPAGNILSVRDATNGGQTESFGYDALGRLDWAQTSGGGYSPYSIDYAYNNLGNLTNVAWKIPSTPPAAHASGWLAYPAAGQARPHAVTSTQNGFGYLYDANGNMIARSEGSTDSIHTFNELNLLTQVEQSQNPTFIDNFNVLDVSQWASVVGCDSIENGMLVHSGGCPPLNRTAYTIEGAAVGEGIKLEFSAAHTETDEEECFCKDKYCYDQCFTRGVNTLPAHTLELKASTAPYRFGLQAGPDALWIAYDTGGGLAYLSLSEVPYQVGATYVLSLSIQPSGAATAQVWRKDSPQTRALRKLSLPAGLAYRFTLTSGGTQLTDKVYLDNYLEQPYSKNEFTYDGDAKRIKMVTTDAAGAVTTTYYPTRFYEQTLTSKMTTQRFYYFASEAPLAVRVKDLTGQNNLYYYLPDHLGSRRVLAVQQNVAAEVTRYYPFGGDRTPPGTTSLTSMHFTGQRLDPTGLHYYNARYYAAGIGRFISPDPLLHSPAFPQNLNLYTYTRNNPLNYFDPTGQDGVSALAFITGVVWGWTRSNLWLFPGYQAWVDSKAPTNSTEYVAGRLVGDLLAMGTSGALFGGGTGMGGAGAFACAGTGGVFVPGCVATVGGAILVAQATGAGLTAAVDAGIQGAKLLAAETGDGNGGNGQGPDVDHLRLPKKRHVAPQGRDGSVDMWTDAEYRWAFDNYFKLSHGDLKHRMDLLKVILPRDRVKIVYIIRTAYRDVDDITQEEWVELRMVEAIINAMNAADGYPGVGPFPLPPR